VTVIGIFHVLRESRADETLTRVRKMARRKTSLPRGIHSCPIFFFISYAPLASQYCEDYVYICTYLTA
jgi:hypothetical protein